jgi:hypothetical protein
MTNIDEIRNSIIDKMLQISDRDYLLALFKLVDNSSVVEDRYKLTEEQKLMLEMSEADIQYNRVISQNDLDKMDTEWLKGM